MTLSKFLIADSSASADDIFVLHTEYPRFIVNMATDEIEWFDEFSKHEAEENADIIETIIKEAYEFFDSEMKSYEIE